MPDPLIESRAMVGEWDGEGRGWTARDWVPGPAGTVGLTLPGGVELDVDVASPGTFVGLWVDAERARQPGLAAIATVTALVGEERATALFALDRSGVRQLPGPADRDPDADRFRRFGRGTDPTEPGVAPELARHVLALADATGRDGSGLVAGLSLLDAAAAARWIDAPGIDGLGIAGLGLEGRMADMVDRAAELVIDNWSADLPIDRPVLTDVIDTVDPWLTQAQRTALRELNGEVDVDEVIAMPSSARLSSAVSERAASAPVSRLRPVDVSALPESFSVVEAAARDTRDAEAEVRIPGRADLAERLWARSFDADGTILAAAPLLAGEHDDERNGGRGDIVARLLIPPASLRGATFDITDRPAEPRVSPRARATVEAIAHGRNAARAERLGDRKETYSRWGRSADAWSRAGDDDRALTARRYAEDPGQGGRVPPALLADPLIESGA
ncbi:MAG: hypothetical protein OSA99_04465 [Acidimicrobiales bacterium]|nr:hypothetical protein [Acidimicrobiales bacterium]